MLSTRRGGGGRSRTRFSWNWLNLVQAESACGLGTGSSACFPLFELMKALRGVHLDFLRVKKVAADRPGWTVITSCAGAPHRAIRNRLRHQMELESCRDHSRRGGSGGDSHGVPLNWALAGRCCCRCAATGCCCRASRRTQEGGVFDAPSTISRECKQLLRAIVAEVVISIDATKRTSALRIIWHSGGCTALEMTLTKTGGHFPRHRRGHRRAGAAGLPRTTTTPPSR
jgi:hypothetical protein